MSKKPEKKVFLNLGCGSNILKSTNAERWINMDAFYSPDDTTDFMQGDLRAIPLESNSVDYVFCDNVLEHLQSCDIPAALWEMRRVLKKGSRAVIIVPDFKAAAEAWLQVNQDTNFDPFLYNHTSEVIYGNQIHDGEFHKTAFSPGFLNYCIRMAGFRDYRMIFHPAFGDVPNYPGVRDPTRKLRQAELVADITKTA